MRYPLFGGPLSIIAGIYFLLPGPTSATMIGFSWFLIIGGMVATGIGLNKLLR